MRPELLRVRSVRARPRSTRAWSFGQAKVLAGMRNGRAISCQGRDSVDHPEGQLPRGSRQAVPLTGRQHDLREERVCVSELRRINQGLDIGVKQRLSGRTGPFLLWVVVSMAKVLHAKD